MKNFLVTPSDEMRSPGQHDFTVQSDLTNRLRLAWRVRALAEGKPEEPLLMERVKPASIRITCDAAFAKSIDTLCFIASIDSYLGPEPAPQAAEPAPVVEQRPTGRPRSMTPPAGVRTTPE